VLERGYSITTLAGHRRPLRDPAAVRPGAELLTTLAKGELRSVVASAPRPRAHTGEEATDQIALFDEGHDT
jgi:hypothetical protein